MENIQTEPTVVLFKHCYVKSFQFYYFFVFLQVTVVATEDCSLLSWKCSSMQRFLHDHPFLGTVVHNLLGKDITSKLYQIQDLLHTNPDYMHCPPSSRQSSMVDIRSNLATKSSCNSLTKMATQNSVELKGQYLLFVVLFLETCSYHLAKVRERISNFSKLTSTIFQRNTQPYFMIHVNVGLQP